MRLYRTFYPDPLNISQFPAEVTLSPESFQHLIKVLRLKAGEQIQIVDNSGGYYAGELSTVEKNKAVVTVTSYTQTTNESPLRLHLIQGISRGDKMDLTIQKAVELGVTEITPIFTERCGVSLSGERLQKKVEHWQGIAVSACLQSYRDVIPKINAPLTLNELLKQIESQEKSSDEVFINLNPFAGVRLNSIAKTVNKATLLIGPEGGLSDTEIEKAKHAGFSDYQLGPRVLRTETVALTVIAILQARLGDI